MSAEDTKRDLDPATLDMRVVRRSFGRAARTYADAATMQRVVSAKAFQRLDGIALRPKAILDAGCGTGFALPEWAERCPDAHCVALDLALPMLLVARGESAAESRDEALRAGSGDSARAAADAPARTALGERPCLAIGDARTPAAEFVCGDINRLPFAAEAFDLVWSNLAVQWINDLAPAFTELWRVLRPGGLLSFTTIGPGTLPELRGAFSNTDEHTHFSRFVDARCIADMLAAAGFVDGVAEPEPFVQTYAEGTAMMRDLQAIGATNATHGRPRGLTGRARWRRMLDALEATPRRDGMIPATFEIIYVRAWKPAATTSASAKAATGRYANERRPARSPSEDGGAPR